jgi:excisionase family DNA binding protein
MSPEEQIIALAYTKTAGRETRVAETVARLAAAVTGLARALKTERRSNESAVAVGKREAARRLGVDRSTTLEEMIKSGVLKVVKIGARIRIPVAELDRLAEVGTATPARALKRRERRSAVTDAEAIERIDLDDL